MEKITKLCEYYNVTLLTDYLLTNCYFEELRVVIDDFNTLVDDLDGITNEENLTNKLLENKEIVHEYIFEGIGTTLDNFAYIYRLYKLTSIIDALEVLTDESNKQVIIKYLKTEFKKLVIEENYTLPEEIKKRLDTL